MPRGNEAAVGDDDGVVDCQRDLAQEVARQQHGATFVGELAEHVPGPQNAFGIESVQRLVEDQDFGVTEEGSAEAEALAHAQGVAAYFAARRVGEADLGQHLVDPPAGNARRGGHDAKMVEAAAPGMECVVGDYGADVVDRVIQVGVPATVEGGGARCGLGEPE